MPDPKGLIRARAGTPGFDAAAFRAARLACRMSARALAEALGCSRQAIYLWEEGRTTPSPDKLAALRLALPELAL